MKILLNATLYENNNKKQDIKQLAILENNKIKYISENTITIFNTKEEIITRKNKDYEIIIEFITKKIIYKYNNNQIEIPIIVKNIQKEKNYHKIEYVHNENKYIYELKWRNI